MSYRGLRLPLAAPGGPPLLLAAVRGTDHRGRPFRWVARRHRKLLSQEHACPSPPPPLRWAACLDARAQARKPGWWVALLFTLGSALFVVSGMAGEFEAVGDPPTQPVGLRSASAALIRWPNVVAANLCFFPAGILQASRGAGGGRGQVTHRVWVVCGGVRMPWHLTGAAALGGEGSSLLAHAPLACQARTLRPAVPLASSSLNPCSNPWRWRNAPFRTLAVP